MDKLILIDGNSLLFRAFFAMRPMITSKGVHTQGIYAFINMLNKILDDYKPDYIAVAFDMKEKTFRHDRFAEYKAGRQQTPIELLSEIPLLHKVLDAMNIAVLKLPKYEADDIIGTLSVEATRRGLETLVISGDKDELQLVSEHVRVLLNKKGMSEFDIYDLAAMKERYNLTPKQFIDLKALMGDSSDNIPGIKGIGEKTGISLLEKYETLEGVIEHAYEIKGKVGEKVRDGVEDAKLSKWLATINLKTPIDYNWEDLRYIAPNYSKLLEIYTELELNSFIKKLKSSAAVSQLNIDNFAATDDMEEDNSDAISSNSVMKDIDEIKRLSFEEFISHVHNGSEVYIEAATDSNHLDAPSLRSILLYSEEERAIAILDITPMNEELATSTLLRKKYKLIGCNLKRIIYTFASIQRSEMKEDFIPYYDIEIAEYLLSPNTSNYSIDKMLLRYCNYVTGGDEASYVGEKIGDNTLNFSNEILTKRLYYSSLIRQSQGLKLTELGLDKLFYDIEMPLVTTLSRMELEGISCKRDILESIGEELSARIQELESKIYELSGREFNINSPKQLGILLFENLGIPYPKSPSKTGSYSTAQDVLEKLEDDYEVIKYILEYRKVSKLRSTYVEGLISMISSDGRIHPRFQQTVAATGRLSCTEPNLQNIPIRDDYGRLIRKAFVVAEGNIFTGSDYSQIELRVLASLSNDDAMISDFKAGKDIHKSTAARVFDISEDEVTPLDRTKAKAVNFGVVYGMSGFGLGESLKISRSEGQRYINDYFLKHPSIKAYLDSCVQEGEKNRQVRTYYGRIRQIPEFASRKFMDRELAKRLAMNTPIQGTAADIIKIAMNLVFKALKDNDLESRLILQIHDELIIEGPESELDIVKRILDSCMRSATDLAVELTTDIHSGRTWFELK